MQNIENWLKKFKMFRFEEKHIYQLFLILLFSCMFVLLYCFQLQLSFIGAGFTNLFKNDMQVYYFYVGQGDASLVIFPDKTSMLIDTGTSEYADELVKQINVIFKNNDISDIDYLILSHPHDDHIGGASKILDTYQVNNILRPKINASSDEDTFVEEYIFVATDAYSNTISSVNSEPNCNVTYIEPMEFDISDYTIKFWTPSNDYYSDLNSYSPIITITKDYTFMFTADATTVTEGEFLKEVAKSFNSIHVDFLKVAHHGSKASSTENFLSEVSPSYAFISCGENNIYSHPNIETLERLENIKVFDTYVTANLGLIAVGLSGSGYQIISSKLFFDLPLLVICYLCLIFISLKVNIVRLPKKRKIFIKSKSQKMSINY